MNIVISRDTGGAVLRFEDPFQLLEKYKQKPFKVLSVLVRVVSISI